MQSKTAIRYHYTPIRMAKIWNTDNTKCWPECGATGNPSHIVSRNVKWYTTLENSLAFS